MLTVDALCVEPNAAAQTGLAARVATAYRRLMDALGPDVAVTLDASQPPDVLAEAAVAALVARGIAIPQ